MAIPDCFLVKKLRKVALYAALLMGMAGYTSIANADAIEIDCSEDCFVLTSVTIQGVSAYDLADLAPTYDENLARRIGIVDLVQTADAITEHYRRDGFFLSRAVVAPSDHSAGAAYIVVYEGYIGAIVVEGSGADVVSPILQPLRDGRALTVGALDRRLALASDIPGIRLTSRVEPMLDDPSQHKLVVTADLDRIDGGIYADNRGSEAQGPWQAYVTASVNSAVIHGDRLTVSGLTVPENTNELTFGEIAYSAPIGEATRMRASISGYTTNAPPGSSGWLSGQSQAASLAVTQALVRFRDTNLWATAALDVRQVEQTYHQLGAVKERLSVARFTLAGRRKLGHGYLAATAQVSQGLDWFDATTEPSSNLTRADATSEFTKFTANVSAYQDLGRYVGIYAEGSAQYSADPLLASEEFYVGGPSIGRAYNYGELSGDTGMSGVVELRVGWDPKPAAISFAQGYAFVDAAQVVNHTPTGDIRRDLSSAGIGTRITFQERATFKVELSKPLGPRPYTEPDNGWRVFVAVSKEF
jgi:hemolysin activation/secretion protein